MVWECISAHCIGEFYICEGTIKAEWYIFLLEQHMLPPRWSKTAPSHTLHLLQQDASEEKCLCAKPAPIKNIWHITSNCWAFEIPLSNKNEKTFCFQKHSSVAKILQTVVRGQVMQHSGNYTLVACFEMCSNPKCTCNL